MTSPYDNAIIDGEGVIRETSDIPCSDLDLLSKYGAQGELIRARDSTTHTHLTPLCHLVLYSVK